MTYQRTGRIGAPDNTSRPKTSRLADSEIGELPNRNAKGAPTPTEDGGVRINGFHQVLEMLKVADMDFRISLLKRMYKAEPRTARMLHKELVIQGFLKE